MSSENFLSDLKALRNFPEIMANSQRFTAISIFQIKNVSTNQKKLWPNKKSLKRKLKNRRSAR